MRSITTAGCWSTGGRLRPVVAAPPRSSSGTLLISHRFSTVGMADLIIVLNDGRVAESGTHAELMARDGAYAALYAVQARSYR